MRIAILGATGVVGSEILKCLENSSLQPTELILMASKESEGKKIETKWGQVKVTQIRFVECDLVFSALSTDIAAKILPEFFSRKIHTIDNSSAFRFHRETPIVVPPINSHRATSILVANPNCSTAQLAVATYPILKHFGIEDMFVATYQSVSGGGKKLISEWQDEDSIWHDNCVPLVGTQKGEKDSVFYTNQEEEKISTEYAKITSSDVHPRSITVRVSTFRSHGEAVYIKTKRRISRLTLLEALRKFEPHLILKRAVTPKESAGNYAVFIGKIEIFDEHSLAMWIVADNLLKGAAYNAVQIAEAKLHYGCL